MQIFFDDLDKVVDLCCYNLFIFPFIIFTTHVDYKYEIIWIVFGYCVVINFRLEALLLAYQHYQKILFVCFFRLDLSLILI